MNNKEENSQSKTYGIKGMHCPSCVIRVESIEDELAGILLASASYHKQHVIVEYDEQVVSEEQILAYLKSLGYQAVPEE